MVDGQALRETASCKMGGSWLRPSSLVSSLETEPVTQHKHRFIDWFLFDVDMCLILPHGRRQAPMVAASLIVAQVWETRHLVAVTHV